MLGYHVSPRTKQSSVLFRENLNDRKLPHWIFEIPVDPIAVFVGCNGCCANWSADAGSLVRAEGQHLVSTTTVAGRQRLHSSGRNQRARNVAGRNLRPAANR